MACRACALSVVLILLCSSGSPAEEETPPGALYYRGVATEKGVFGLIGTRAIAGGCDAVLVVLDTATFRPPPGLNEFNFTHDFPSDVPKWLDAIEAFRPPEGCRVFAAATMGRPPVEVGTKGWATRLLSDLELEWWKLKRLPSATSWMSRLLAKAPGNSRMLVLITGEVLPESWADSSVRRFRPGAWRRNLPDPGEYWNEEAVASYLRGASARLVVVAPEARFGDFLPVTDIPDAPWASRPWIPLTRETARAMAQANPTEGQIDALVKILRKSYPNATDEELRKMARELFEKARSGEVTPGEDDEDDRPPIRFSALTPLFMPHYGSYTFFNTDCPSRFGYWPFARAAARTGGAYVFYPFPAANFLDRCPVDPVLLRKLAPPLCSRREYVQGYSRDPALKALIKATEVVSGPTPWKDGFCWLAGLRRAPGWLGFASASPATLHSRHRERNKPFDWVETRQCTVGEWKRYGKKLSALLPLYDRAIGILVKAESRARIDGPAGSRRRSETNLRLARFWFEMSAFHLHALSLYASELDQIVPEEVVRKHKRTVITYVPTIRLSDCLLGYEGRVLTEAMEEEFQCEMPELDGEEYGKRQGNIPYLGIENPWYRAFRHPARVLLNLDPRLKPRALRMIDAAELVMRHEGKSPWGWMVYYSEAYTFIWRPMPEGLLPTERVGDAPEPPEGTSTPRPKPRAVGPGSGGR